MHHHVSIGAALFYCASINLARLLASAARRNCATHGRPLGPGGRKWRAHRGRGRPDDQEQGERFGMECTDSDSCPSPSPSPNKLFLDKTVIVLDLIRTGTGIVFVHALHDAIRYDAILGSASPPPPDLLTS